MESFQCYYCSTQTMDFSEIIDHCVIAHGDNILKLKVLYPSPTDKMKTCMQTKTYSVAPNEIRRKNQIITPVLESRTIRISNIPEIYENFISPIKKIPKLSSTPKKKNSLYGTKNGVDDVDEGNLSAYFEDMSLLENCTAVQTEECVILETGFDDLDKEMIRTVVQMIPDVLRYLKSSGMERTYVKFSRLLAEKRFPLSNIAFLLFSDVVEWFSADNTHNIRYSEEVKQFWNVGSKLFKGKFLRFMSGMKNLGQNAKGLTKPENSCINFAVPSRQCLEDTFMSEKLQNIKPGILEHMIHLVSKDDIAEKKTFKLCVDGKKINVGVTNQKYGDVNLWGHEGPPSLADIQEKLESDKEVLQELFDILDKLEQKNVDTIEATLIGTEQLVKSAQNIIHVLSTQIKVLRTVKQRKIMTLEKLKKACTNEEMKVKYSYAVSAIKTFVYQISVCISRILNSIDKLGKLAAVLVCSGKGHLYQLGSRCDLSATEKYVCLTGPDTQALVDEERLKTSFIKQKSDVWFELRKTVKVTGSTCHAALGLSGLKKMKEHFERVVNSVNQPLPSDEESRRMQYGTDNEINAIGTLVSKVLPIYYPDLVYVEEGAESVMFNEEKFLIVSPDGSIRKYNPDVAPIENIVIKAVEVKCPYPGKIYTTPVYYEIPWYYTTQILAEMYVLGVSSLIFLCYSEESMTVFEADFDMDLWDEIMTRLLDIYGKDNPVIMKKLPEGISAFSERIKQYCKEKTRFVAEVPSLKISRVCTHPSISSDPIEIGLNRHFSNQNDPSTTDLKTCSVAAMLTNWHDMNESLTEAYSLGKHLASEVLIFLISDLDRIHESEKQYAVPVAYALKGYSLTSTVLKQMIDDVLTKCFQLGLYVPAVSYDGQWSRLAVRSGCGAPLTVLQLQKDVFKDAKAASRTEIMDVIKKSNVVEARSIDDVIDQTYCNLTLDYDNHFVGGIELMNARRCSHVFQTSASVRKLLISKGTPLEEKETQKTEQSLLLDNFPPDIADNIAEDLLQQMDSATICEHVTKETDTEGVSLLFAPHIDTTSDDDILVHRSESEVEEMEIEVVGNSFQSSTSPFIHTQSMDIIEYNDTTSFVEGSKENSNNVESLLSIEDKQNMLVTIRSDPKYNLSKWKKMNYEQFLVKFESVDMIMNSFTKHELQLCIRAISKKLKSAKVHFLMSWKKDQMANFIHNVVNDKLKEFELKPSTKKKQRLLSLKASCVRVISRFSKHILSCIYAEYLFPTRLIEWRKASPFVSETYNEGVETFISWYSKPEYIQETFTYSFHLLDCHHLFVNARVKCCSTGMTECGISKEAWMKVASESLNNKSGLSLAIVRDLVDKQSNAFAQKTFSGEVEEVMRANGDVNEADFCRLIRQWYAAEDEPGLDISERIRRRLRLREWLLRDVNFYEFPPPGTHVKGIPHIMFEGLLTNIERRIQIIPFVKSGACNPRALGSLEAENFFGEFQELDPKGSGVIRPDDIPKAISTACELIGARLDPNRKFYMHTSTAKVYPVHQFSCSTVPTGFPEFYVMPNFVDKISPRNHPFDEPLRARRKFSKRKSGEISAPAMTSRGARSVREHHRCDESKIFPHIRLGISLPE